MTFDTPILFIIFNRPKESKVVFESIKRIAPRKLYIAADGPRPDKPLDIKKCKETREIIKLIDWDCELHTQFREENLGSGKGVSDAISWFFQNESQGIILEDDCVPDISFYPFCEELLNKFKDDKRIMHIAGSNHNPAYVRDSEYSYYFSQIGLVWGWATWKRAWELSDITMSNYSEISDKNYFKDLYANILIRKYLKSKFKKTHLKVINDVWDYQWEFARLINSGLTIMPVNNLVNNIGFGPDATHTLSDNTYFADAKIKPLIFPLKHPPFIIKDVKSENRHFNKLFLWILKRKIFSIIGIKGYNFNG